MLQTGKKETVL